MGGYSKATVMCVVGQGTKRSCLDPGREHGVLAVFATWLRWQRQGRAGEKVGEELHNREGA